MSKKKRSDEKSLMTRTLLKIKYILIDHSPPHSLHRHISKMVAVAKGKDGKLLEYTSIFGYFNDGYHKINRKL